MATTSQQSLIDLGLTGLEAEVFTFLLTESPATGYRVAQALGKPAANTYKAIESLEKKGAVFIEQGSNRLCRAVPANELLAGMERRFRETKAKAEAALAGVQPSGDDDRVYTMTTRPQVMERCRSMLADAKHVALLDVFPGPLEDLAADIEKAAARGVTCFLKVYDEAAIPGVDVARLPRGREVIARWPGDWINIVTDGREYVLAFLARDGDDVRQAVWSNSAYLSWIYHGGLASEITMAEIQSVLEGGGTLDDIKQAARKHDRLLAPEAPGYRQLARRFGSRSKQPTKEDDR